MLANFIELLAEILVESLDHPQDSEDLGLGEVRASTAAVKESTRAGTKEVPQAVVRETTV